METNFLLRGFVSGRLYTERWVSWYEARRAKPKLESAGYQVMVHWLDPDCMLRDVTGININPEKV